MRIGFAGNGSLGDPGATIRDGTVEDRWELFRGLEEAGVEVRYLAPPGRSPGDERAVGYSWEGHLDALVLETRDAVWPAVVPCLLRQGQPCDYAHSEMGTGAGRAWESLLAHGGKWGPGNGYQACVHAALSSAEVAGSGNGEQAYTQAWTLLRWFRGEFNGEAGQRPVLLAWDFDLNVRRALGVNGRTSTFETGAFWRKATPWMGLALEAVRADGRTRWLTPYAPERAPWAKRTSARSVGGGRLEARLFRWTYPERLEVAPGDLAPWQAREYDMVYTGSDYDRRRKWMRYYGDGGIARGARVAVTGTWGDRRGGREDGEYGEKGFRSRLSAWAEKIKAYGELTGGDEFARTGLEFLSPATTIQLPYGEAMQALSQARVSVQIVPPAYETLGYHTNRWSEIWARGALGFIDPDIADVGDVCPDEWVGVLAQGDPERIATAWRKLRDGNEAMLRWSDVVVGSMRSQLKDRFGRQVQAARLLDIVEEARTNAD